MATTPNTLSEPIRVANLPLPPDVAEEVDRYCRSRRLSRRKRTAVEEDCRLRHHYAGHVVDATAGPDGLRIHAIDLEGPEANYELRKRLRAQGHRRILCLVPIPWRDPDDQIFALNS